MGSTSQVLIEQSPWALLAIPATVLGIAMVYGIALLGQWRAHAQMLQLKSFFDVVICAQALAEIEAANPSELRAAESHSSCVQCRQLCQR